MAGKPKARSALVQSCVKCSAPSTWKTIRATTSSAGAVVSFRPGSEIYGADQPAEYLYKVLSGTVRTFKILEDGRRQIGSFYSSDDLFGFENESVHTFSAEAIGNCNLLMSLASRNNKLANEIWLVTAAELERAVAI